MEGVIGNISSRFIQMMVYLKKSGYMGIEFKRGNYISRDTLHHEWEWFRNPKKHLGAINPLTGEKYKKGDPSRILKLP